MSEVVSTNNSNYKFPLWQTGSTGSSSGQQTISWLFVLMRARKQLQILRKNRLPASHCVKERIYGLHYFKFNALCDIVNSYSNFQILLLIRKMYDVWIYAFYKIFKYILMALTFHHLDFFWRNWRYEKIWIHHLKNLTLLWNFTFCCENSQRELFKV